MFSFQINKYNHHAYPSQNLPRYMNKDIQCFNKTPLIASRLRNCQLIFHETPGGKEFLYPFDGNHPPVQNSPFSIYLGFNAFAWMENFPNHFRFEAFHTFGRTYRWYFSVILNCPMRAMNYCTMYTNCRTFRGSLTWPGLVKTLQPFSIKGRLSRIQWKYFWGASDRIFVEISRMFHYVFTIYLATLTLTLVCKCILKLTLNCSQNEIRTIATIVFGYFSQGLLYTTSRTGPPRWYRTKPHVVSSTFSATRLLLLVCSVTLSLVASME